MNGLTVILGVGFGILWGFLCMNMAEKINANKGLAFFLGFIFGLFAVAGYAIAMVNYRNANPSPTEKSDDTKL